MKLKEIAPSGKAFIVIGLKKRLINALRRLRRIPIEMKIRPKQELKRASHARCA